MEFHGNTLTETRESAQALLEAANHPNLYTLWQPIYWGDGATASANADILRALLSRMAHVHVFAWEQKITGTPVNRFPLAHGETDWKQYLALLTANLADTSARWLCLKFVAQDAPENLSADAANLKRWLAEANEGV